MVGLEFVACPHVHTPGLICWQELKDWVVVLGLLTIEGELVGEYDVWVCTLGAKATDVCSVEVAEIAGSLATGLLVVCSLVTSTASVTGGW